MPPRNSVPPLNVADALTEQMFNEARRLGGIPVTVTGSTTSSRTVDNTIGFGEQPFFSASAFESARRASQNGRQTSSISIENHEGILKERHLRKSERDVLHKPKTDYLEGGKGEVCKNACSLEIDDIVEKFTS